MPVRVLELLLKELIQFASGENVACPTDKWTIQNSLRLLQQYPAGISKAVLLTELDYLWKTYQKRGEHVGKLKQAVTTKQLCVSDVLTGDLTAVDEYRCIFGADGVSCGMIMHRQWFDWMMFLQSVGVEAVNGRRCVLTQCRVLNLSPPLLLPTPLSVFQLRLEDALEAFLVQDVFQMMHKLFAGRFIDPHLRLLPPTAALAAAADASAGYATPLGSESVELPDNSETLVLCAEVLGSSAVRQYQAAGAGGSGGAEYQVVTLRLRGADGGEPVGRVCIAYLILFDDQVALSRLWRKHDHLVLYRPYLRANGEEERLFGDRRAADGAALTPDPALFEFLPPADSSCSPSFVNYHLLYGSVTVVCKLESETPSVPLPADRSDTLSPNEKGPGAVFGTVLSLKAVEGAAQSRPEAELWLLQVTPPSDPRVVPAGATRLLRIRCSADALRAMCPGAGLESTGTLADLPLRAGQCVFIASGIDILATSTLALLPAREDFGNFQSGLVSSFGGDTQVFCCTTAAARQDGTSDEVGHVSSEATIVPLCSLPALACSPSLFSPLPLVQALKVFRTASAGCVLVQASLQPMHPSVRMLPAAEAPPGMSVESSGKRQRCGDDDDIHVPAGDRTRSGYQLMRLRDASGEALCVLESRVGVSAASGDIVAVRHCVVNTTSSLFFDPASGQMTRAPSAAVNTSVPVAPTQYAMLLARVDDASVDCPVLRHLRVQQAAAGRAVLPTFRIETICDAQPLCVST